MRLEKVLKEMQKRQLTHLIISDPSSIDYLINYKIIQVKECIYSFYQVMDIINYL